MDRREFVRHTTLATLGTALLAGCSGGTGGGSVAPSAPVKPSAPATPLPAVTTGRTILGIDTFAAQGFAAVKGLRCGLVTHRAGFNGSGVRTADVLARAPGVRLTKLFGPEHGIDGTAAAEIGVKNAKDARTGLPVYSLYGATRRPTPEMLEGLDVMVVDFQDIGSRSYTYISCLRLVLEACFSLPRPIRVIVLDRPNPLGGEKVDGPFLDRKWRSYVGSYEMPYVHGLTIGEIARWAVATPGVLELDEATRRRGSLEVIPLQNWSRARTWDQTGLTWVPTSPFIATPQAAFGYAMTGLGCQLGEFTHGAAGQLPFRFLKAGKRKSVEIVAALGAAVPGLTLEPRTLADGTQGVYTTISDWARFKPCAISLHMMRQSCLWDPTNPFARATATQRELFIKHTGSEAFFEELRTKGARVDLPRWLAKWDAEAAGFRARTAPFRLYA